MIVPMVTPIDSNGEIDLTAVERDIVINSELNLTAKYAIFYLESLMGFKGGNIAKYIGNI